MANIPDAKVAYEALSLFEKEEFKAFVLSSPSSRISDLLWILTFAVLAVVIIGGALLAIKANGSDETALYGFVGIALGAFAGLLAPSPVSK